MGKKADILERSYVCRRYDTLTAKSRSDKQARIGELLFEKFPQAVEYEPDDTEEFTFIRLDPKVISVLDYRKGFGHTEQVELDF